MTIPSEINRSGPYLGNGVTTVFPYGFKIEDEAHIQVIRATALNVETVLVIDTDYTVTGVGDEGGGNVVMNSALASGLTLTFLLNIPFTQETDLENQGAYFAETVEAAFDLAAQRDLQLLEKINRAVLLPASSDDEGGALAAELAANITRLAQSADEIDTVAGISDDVETVAGISDDVALLADVSGVLSGTASAVRMDEKVFVGDGSATAWTLDRAPGVDENVLVWIGGSIQNTDDYSVSGVTLMISPAVADDVEIRTLIMTLVTANDVEAMVDDASDLLNQATAKFTYTFDTKALAIAANIPVPVKTIELRGYSSLGDGVGGMFTDINNGSSDTFIASGRTWYRVKDVGRERLTPSVSKGVSIIVDAISDVRAVASPSLLNGALADIPGRSYQYDETSEFLDNGVSVLKPIGVDVNDPGRWVMRPGVFNASFEMTLGASGDFTSLEDALAFMSRFKPEYIYGRGGVYNKINLKILAGTTLTEGICAEHGQDLSHIRLISEDAIVPVNFNSDLWWAYAEGYSKLPHFAAIFDLQHIGFDGVALKFGSEVIFEYENDVGPFISGVINAARHNVFINTNSRGSFRRGQFTGAGDTGIHFEKGCSGTVRGADVSDAANFGIHMMSGCLCDADSLIANNVGVNAVRASVGGQITGGSMAISACGDVGIRATQGGKILARGTVFSSMAGETWAYADGGGSEVTIDGSTGVTGATAILVANGGSGSAIGVDASALSGQAFRVLTGGVLKAAGSTGTVSQTVNTPTNNGIIFR